LFYAIAGAGGALVTLRWLLQKSENIYTDLSKQLYIPDPDLGFRLQDTGAVWLGMDAILASAAICVLLVVGERLLSKREQTSWSQGLRSTLRGAALLPAVVASLAFASGQRPNGARDFLPPAAAQVVIKAGEAKGSLPTLPAGDYGVAHHEGTYVAASLTAGGERFDARFAGSPAGSLRFDPSDLTQPLSATISIASDSVETGIELRDKHAREELQTDLFPRLVFRLRKIIGVTQKGHDAVAFEAEGQMELMGREHPVVISGTLRALDAAGKKRLGLSGDAFIVRAHTELLFSEIAVENDGTFDSDRLPIQVSLVLERHEKQARNMQ
jgi:polyisoprenoid-binding protein YceI